MIGYIFLQSIDRVTKLEADFFPVLAGELGSSIEAANEYQQRLDNFMPEFEVNYSVVFTSGLKNQITCCFFRDENILISLCFG